MSALPRRAMMTIEEYLELDRSSIETRYEYIDGYIRMMSGGTIDHAALGANIISILRNLLRGGPCRVLTSDARVRISETRYVYPDVTVSCDSRDRGRIDIVRSPRLIVEILSPSTEAFDRGRKLALYRACPTVQEYMLVDYQSQSIEIYRREKNILWTYRALGEGDEVELSSLQVHFPVSAVYEDVFLPPDNDDMPA